MHDRVKLQLNFITLRILKYARYKMGALFYKFVQFKQKFEFSTRLSLYEQSGGEIHKKREVG